MQTIKVENDQIKLQRELAYRLDSIDKELNFYKIDKEELLNKHFDIIADSLFFKKILIRDFKITCMI